jgi:hypothetical protein
MLTGWSLCSARQPARAPVADQQGGGRTHPEPPHGHQGRGGQGAWPGSCLVVFGYMDRAAVFPEENDVFIVSNRFLLAL